MKEKTIILSIFFALISWTTIAQNIFGKNPYLNQQKWDDQRIFYGYYIGMNNYNFKYNYDKTFFEKYRSNQIIVNSELGFNVGLVGNLRLFKHLALRFEPGLQYAKRQITYPHILNENRRVKELGSTYIHLPLLLKFSATRTGNIRPYVLGGISESLNLSAREDAREDNYEGTFRMKRWTTNYEIGLGIDLYFQHFIFSPSIRGVFGVQDELIRDYNKNSIFTGGIESLQTRAILINFTFH